jgi:hydroxymethylpyrimidine pyrophosphatase-like HAD family hydrolase
LLAAGLCYPGAEDRLMAETPDIRMIGADFDGTLWGGAEGLPSGLRRLLVALREGGVEAGLVSGRYWWEMRDLLAGAGLEWGDPFPSFVITRETFIYWIGLDAMEPDQDWNEARGAELAELTAWLCRRETEWRLRLESAGLRPKRWWLWGDYGLEVWFETVEETAAAQALLVSWCAAQPLAHAHRNRCLAHVVLATAGKGACLERAAATRGVAPQQVLALGDSLNDLTMLDGGCGFHAAAPSNAEPEVQTAVRAAGGWVAESAAGDGVAEVLLNARARGWFR